MTISLRAAGTATSATAAITAVAPAVPSGATTGDLSVLDVYVKPYTTTVTTPTDWVKIGEATAGTVTTTANDTGSAKILTYVRESASVGAIPAITQSGADSMGAVINTYAKSSSQAWDYSAFTTGADAASGANYAATGAGGLDVAAGDWVHAATALNGDIGTLSAFAIGGMSGATLGTYTNRQNAAVTTGFDTRGVVGDVPISAGSSSAAPTFTYTNTSSTYGVTLWLRLREADFTSDERTNSFMGVDSGTAITDVAQTGGASGDAFDALSFVGIGVGLAVNTSADLTDAYDRGLIANLNSQANSEAFLRWNHAMVSTSYQRVYYRTPSANPNANTRLFRAFSGTSQVWEFRHGTTGHLLMAQYPAGTTLIQTTNPLSFDTVYRIELKAAVGGADCILNVYVGEDTGSPVATTSFAANYLIGSWNNIRFGAACTTALTNTPNLAGIGWSNVDFLGPALVAGGNFYQEVAASCTATGSFLKTAGRIISDPVTSTATFTKMAGLFQKPSVSALGTAVKKPGITSGPTITASASVPKQVQKPFALSATAAPSVVKTAKKSWSLASSATSTLRRAVGKEVSATLTPTGTMTKTAQLGLIAASSLTSVLGKVNGKLVTLTATVASTTTLQREIARTMALSSPQVATVVKAGARSLESSASVTATSLRGVEKTLSDLVTGTGSMSRRAGLSRLVAVTSTASTTKAATKTFLSTSTATASVDALKTFLKMLSATVGTQAQFERSLALVRSLTASVSPSSTIARGVSRTITAVETGSASFTRGAFRTLTGVVTSTSTFTTMRVMLREIAASVTASAGILREIGKSLSDLLAPSADVVKETTKTASASVEVLTSFVYGFLRDVTLSTLIVTSSEFNRFVSKTSSVLVNILSTRKYKKKRPLTIVEESRIRVYPRSTSLTVTTRERSYLILGATDPVPANLPENTIIVRRPVPRWHP